MTTLTSFIATDLLINPRPGFIAEQYTGNTENTLPTESPEKFPVVPTIVLPSSFKEVTFKGPANRFK